MVDYSEIFELFKNRAHRPMSLKDIQRALDLNVANRKEIGKLLKALVREGSLVQVKGGRFAMPKQISLVAGTLSVHRDGYGFVSRADGKDDIFIPARYVRPAMHGDRVIVRLEKGLKSRRFEGRIVRVEQRAQNRIVGRFQSTKAVGYLVPADPRLRDDIIIPAGHQLNARSGEMVIAEIETYPSRSRAASARVVDVLGEASDPDVEIRVAAIRFGLPYEFSQQALAEATQIPKSVLPEDLPGRADLRHLPFVTIDGETARDFDDAVHLEALPGKGYRLRVGIADVAHYVKAGSAIDDEALERGTSVYFPGNCLPMLPEALSNEICSLVPGADRLVMLVDLEFDKAGQRMSSHFYPAVIHSRARLTYTEVAAILLDKDPQTRTKYADLIDQLEMMSALAKLRILVRSKRGSLDLDLPEAEIHLDLRGRPENIVRAKRNLAHQVIEEFMLAANEAVADWLDKQHAKLIFRVHEPPTEAKISAFQEFIAWFNQGLSIPAEGVKTYILQDLLKRVEGRPEERVINQVLLRSLPQAYYSAQNLGHFGLASDCYCHFTSPIRRYPDLTVHRILKAKLGLGSAKMSSELNLESIALRSSHSERRAMEAERDIVNLKKCQIMVDLVGEKFQGLITSVQPFGFFVELVDIFVEGLVHISSLSDDFYQYDEERHRLLGMQRRRVFEIGMSADVRVHKVDIDRREIDFQLDEIVDRGALKGQAKPFRQRTRKNKT
ncbi:MAG: ribonuclease R [Deltaproteobacteria bacterium]|jgi:ribonuclease R|nr:ribonuclease R [Deltaproteobacteria bacterium]